VLSVDVDAEFVLPKVSVTVLAAIDGITVPEPPVTVVAVNVQVMLSRVDRDHVRPVAEPFCTISSVVNVPPPTAREKTTR
jgi:hypothetical protein